MANKPRQREYSVYAHLHLEVTQSVMAVSLEEAVQKAKELDQDDFVKVLGECCDSTMKLHGVFGSEQVSD